MNINNAFPSKYLRSADVPSDTVFTIRSVVKERIGMGAQSEEKPVIYFQESPMGFVCNKTNAKVIASLFGPETNGWTGKQITLYTAEVEFQGEMTEAIRTRLKSPDAHAPSLGNMVSSAKAAAWNLFKSMNSSFSPEQARELFKTAFADYFPGRDAQSIGLNEWNRFAADKFVKQAASDPLPEEEAVVADDDIPF